MGILSVGSSKALFSIEHPAFSRRITGIFGRDIRACAEGDQEAKSRSRSAFISVPCCGYPATSGRGACRGSRGRLPRRIGGSEVEPKLALGGSRTSNFDIVLQFNRRCRHRSLPGCAVLALLGQGIPDLGTPRYFNSRCLVLPCRPWACPYDHGTSLPELFAPTGQPH